MRSEENSRGSEFQKIKEGYLTEEPDYNSASDIVKTANEFSDAGAEFWDMSTIASEEDTARKQKKKEKRKGHQSLVRKMSYMVASTVAVVVLSMTLGGTIEQNVVTAGGSVDGDLRFSIQWNEQDNNHDDLDAHCIEPGGYEIFFGNANVLSPAQGVLDVDIIQPSDSVAVENIIYADRKEMEEGTYQLAVHCYSKRDGVGGFKAQIEIMGIIYNFKYEGEMEQGDTIVVAEVTLQNGRLSLDNKLDKK